MRRVVSFGIFLVLLAAPAGGQDRGDAPAGPRDPVAEVVAAFESDDPAALKALAAADSPDPWTVADRICGRGARAAALAFARAAPRKDTAALPAYLESREPRADEELVREKLRRAGAAISARDHAAAIENLEGAGTDSGDVLSVLVLDWRSRALEGLERHAEAAKGFEAAGRTAESIGWLRRASYCLGRAGRCLYLAGDPAGGLRCLELRLRVAERRGNPIDKAAVLYGQAFMRGSLGEHERAVELFRSSAALYREAGRLESAADSLSNLASQLAGRGEQDRAIAVYEEMRGIFGKIGNLAQVARCWIDAGSCHFAAARPEEAVAFFDRGAPLAKEAGARRYHCIGLHNAAHVLLELGRPEEAEKRLGELIEISRDREGDPFHRAALRLLGRALLEQRREEDAIPLLREALAACRSAGDLEQEALVAQQLGFLHDGRGDCREAIRFHLRALEIRTAQEDDAGIAAALNNLGIVHWRLGETRQAVDCYERGLVAAERAGHTRWQANLLSNLGECRERLFDHDLALETHERAYRLYLSVKDWSGASSALTDVAKIARNRGNILRAFELFEEALELAERSKSPRQVARAQECLAVSHCDFGEHRKALELHRRSRECFERLGPKRDLAIADFSIGRELRCLGEFEHALASLEKSAAAAEELQDRDWLSTILQDRSFVLRKLERFEEALAVAEDALRAAESSDEPTYQAASLECMGEANRRLRRYTQAEDCYRRALACYQRSGSGARVADCLGRMARVALSDGRPKGAAAFAEEAVGELRLHSRGLGEERAAAVREEGSTVYAVGARAGIEMGDPALAVRFLEEGRAAVLLEALKGREALRHALVPPELREQERLARIEEKEATVAVRQAEKSGRLGDAKAARKRLAAAREGLFEVADRIRRTAKAQASGIGPEIDSPARIRGRLREGEVLVYYARLLSDCAALVVTPAKVRTVELGKYAVIRQAAALDLADPSQDVEEAVARLRRLLIEPLGLGPAVGRILVSPDRELAFLPLSLLAPGREVAFVPSGTAWGLLATEREARGTSVLALGDPDYGVREGPAAAPVVRSGWKPVPLPRSRDEAKAIGDVLLLGGKATETGLLEAVAARPRWRAIHLACHGYRHADRPSLSALALTPEEERDGYLTCAEILISRFPADLVTLSACDTARGEVFRAEGVIGLTRAFLSTGAPRVLSSLWKVDDEATAALMVKFYELWNPPTGGGLPAAAALGRAQEFVRSHEKWKHPFFWAAWVLWGLPD